LAFHAARIGTPIRPTPRGVVVGAPPSFSNLGQFDAASGIKVTKVHPSI
jgi:hypothetical protein